MWESSYTKDRTCGRPALGGRSLATGPPGKSRNFTLMNTEAEVTEHQRHREGSSLPLCLYCVKPTRLDIKPAQFPASASFALFFNWPFTAVPREKVSCPFSSFHSGQKWQSYDNSELVFSYLGLKHWWTAFSPILDRNINIRGKFQAGRFCWQFKHCVSIERIFQQRTLTHYLSLPSCCR